MELFTLNSANPMLLSQLPIAILCIVLCCNYSYNLLSQPSIRSAIRSLTIDLSFFRQLSRLSTSLLNISTFSLRILLAVLRILTVYSVSFRQI